MSNEGKCNEQMLPSLRKGDYGKCAMIFFQA